MVNNAGIGGTRLWNDADDMHTSLTLNTNLKAVIDGTRIAIRYWKQSNKSQAAVVNTASQMAFFPMEFGPVYGAAKAGVVNFTASCATLAPQIRVNAVAPNFADTNIIKPLKDSGAISLLAADGLHTVDEVVDQMIRCIEDESLAGDVIRMLPGKEPKVHDGCKAERFGINKSHKL